MRFGMFASSHVIVKMPANGRNGMKRKKPFLVIGLVSVRNFDVY